MSRTAQQFVLLLIVPAMLAASAYVQGGLNRARADLGLTRVTPLENAPPLLAFSTVALGGFRGLIANALWIHANEMQSDGRYFEMIQLADWITTLQPHFATVWQYQAWNMTYNISIKFKDPADRWHWVRSGIELLRDKALVYNPRDPQLYFELSRFFKDKMGYYMDDAHFYFKQQWIIQMARVFGPGAANLEELINPTTDDARARAKLLRELFKLDPVKMREVDRAFGPLEWRLPEAHAIYWAKEGLQYARGPEELSLRRQIYQSMQMTFHRGRLIPNQAERKFEFGPNLAIVAKVNETYELMMAEDAEHRTAMETGHQNFMKDAVYFLYIHNRTTEAAEWLTKLRARYPNAVPAQLGLDDFAVARINEQLSNGSIDRVRAALNGLITSAYHQLSLGEDDQAEALSRLAQRVWQHHQQRFAGQEQRAGFPPLAQMRQEILNQLLDPQTGIHPQLQLQLRTKLNLPAAGNPPQKP